MIDHSTERFEQFVKDFKNLPESQQTPHTAKELHRQACILSRAADIRLEVEVRRVFTNLQFELMRGESTKPRNAVFGLYESTFSPQRFQQNPPPDWHELANNILIGNEVATALGHAGISTLESLTESYTTAVKSLEIVEMLDWVK